MFGTPLSGTHRPSPMRSGTLQKCKKPTPVNVAVNVKDRGEGDPVGLTGEGTGNSRRHTRTGERESARAWELNKRFDIGRSPLSPRYPNSAFMPTIMEFLMKRCLPSSNGDLRVSNCHRVRSDLIYSRVILKETKSRVVFYFIENSFNNRIKFHPRSIYYRRITK